jgi:hypothetical protein
VHGIPRVLPSCTVPIQSSSTFIFTLFKQFHVLRLPSSTTVLSNWSFSSEALTQHRCNTAQPKQNVSHIVLSCNAQIYA